MDSGDYLKVSNSELWEFIDSIIYKLNGRPITNYNEKADKLRKQANEMISKIFSATAKRGLQIFEKTIKEAGHDLNDVSELGQRKTKEYFDNILPEIISENLSNLEFMMRASTFITKIRALDGGEFRWGIFRNLSFFGLFALIVYIVPRGPFYIFKLISVIFVIYFFISAIYYIPRKLRAMKLTLEDEFGELSEFYESLIEK